MKKICTFVTAMLMAMGMYAGELTVADGVSTNSFIPVYGAYVDEYIHTQIIYPADSLKELEGKSLTALTFYLSSPAETSWGDARFQICLAEVDEAGFGMSSIVAAFLDASITAVYTGELDGTQSTMLILFEVPYVYAGGNLLFDLQSTATGSWKAATFVGDYDYSREYMAITGNSATSAASVKPNSSRNSKFLPKVTFAFTEGAAGCNSPGAPVATDIAANTVKLSWEAGEDVTSYQFVCVRHGEAPEWVGVAAQNVTEVVLDTLKAYTDYDFFVRSFCGEGEGEQSNASKVSFKTDYSCFAPASIDVEAESIAAYEAVVAWTASGKGETQYQYVCVLSGDTPEWSKAVLTDQLSATLKGLQPVTKYDVYVRSYCAEDDQSESVSASFKTACGAISELPWFVDFKGASTGSLPECWSKVSKGSYPQISSWGARSNSRSVMFNVSAGDTQIVVLPQFVEPIKNLTLSFWYNTDGYDATMEYGYMSEEADTTIFQHLGDTLFKVSAYKQVEVKLNEAASSAANIAFRVIGKSAAFAYLDDIEVNIIPDCPSPKNLSVFNKTYAGATFEWEQGADETVYQYACVLSAEEPAAWTTLEAETHSVAVTDLVPGNEYTFYVRSFCDAEHVGTPLSVVYTPECKRPAGLRVLSLSDASAEIKWIAYNGDTQWKVQYKAASEPEWTLVDTEVNSLVLKDLEPSADYEVRVACVLPCESEYSEILPFATLCAPLVKEDLPIEQNFDGVSDYDLPACWTRMPEGTYPCVLAGSAAYGETGSCLWFYETSEQFLLLPATEQPVNTLTLSFVYKTTSASLQVGYVTAFDAATFVSLADLEPLNAYGAEPCVLDLKEAADNAKYIALRYYNAEGMWPYAVIDNLLLDISGSSTAVENTTVNGKAVKRIENGQLVIEHNGLKYNAQGTQIR